MIDFQNKSLWKLKQDKGMKHTQLEQILVEGEEFMSSYTAGRDYVAFTNKRIIAVNVQGVTGKKQDFTSIPYSKISCFSVETAGVFDLDAELDITISGMGTVRFEFAGSCDIRHIARTIASYTL